MRLVAREFISQTRLAACISSAVENVTKKRGEAWPRGATEIRLAKQINAHTLFQYIITVQQM